MLLLLLWLLISLMIILKTLVIIEAMIVESHSLWYYTRSQSNLDFTHSNLGVVENGKGSDDGNCYSDGYHN